MVDKVHPIGKQGFAETVDLGCSPWIVCLYLGKTHMEAGAVSRFRFPVCGLVGGIIQGNGQDDAQGADDEKAPVFPKQQLESCLK